MLNTVSDVLSLLFGSITQFLNTDVGKVFMSIIILSLVVRILIEIFHIKY